MSDAPRDASVRTILHVSDLHFGPPYRPEIGEALLRIAPELGPDVIVASGDFTQRAKREQFAEARAFLDRLPDVPRVVVPGNHDVPLWRIAERLVRPHALYRAYISQELDGVLHADGATFCFLDTTDPRHAISNGRIFKQQLDLCKQAFADVPDDHVRVVVAHHHFLPAPDFERDRTVPKARRALDVFVRLKVDLILAGHLHRSYIGHSLDVWAGADREHGIVLVQCGTTTSGRGRGREREKNSFNLIELEGDLIHVTHYLHFDDVGGFSPVSRHTFPRPGRRIAEQAEAMRARFRRPGGGVLPAAPLTESAADA